MKTVLVALNAKYIHTNPAVRLLSKCAEEAGVEGVSYYESTVNESAGNVLRALYELSADVYMFSCYIWNVEAIRGIAGDLRKIKPGCVIAAGGPQAGYAGESFLRRNPAFDYVLCGEGENTLPRFLKGLETGEEASCPGLIYRTAGEIALNPPAAVSDMDNLPFAYDDISSLNGRIIYYESMRGCPFSCSYCLAPKGNNLRVRSIELVRQDLKRFLDSRPRRVKFTDRTFNAVKDHAMRVWEYLIRNDNGVTNFHFEIFGDLLDADMLALLEKARPGIFQFEIGVQSLNADTLSEIGRRCDFNRLFENVRAIKHMGNIHLHLDLIAGLPFEDFYSFKKSFDGVHSLKPEQIQLGFLKVLAGSMIEKKTCAYGIEYRDRPPFEVLKTDWLSFMEMEILHGISYMLETYHNSGRFKNILGYILGFFESPFEFYKSLWEYYAEKGYNRLKPSKLEYYNILEGFMKRVGVSVTERARWLCKLDVISWEKPRKIPEWANVSVRGSFYNQIISFLSDSGNISRYLEGYKGCDPKRISREVHIEYFPFNPLTGADGTSAMLFDYSSGRSYALDVLEDEGYELR